MFVNQSGTLYIDKQIDSKLLLTIIIQKYLKVMKLICFTQTLEDNKKLKLIAALRLIFSSYVCAGQAFIHRSTDLGGGLVSLFCSFFVILSNTLFIY